MLKIFKTGYEHNLKKNKKNFFFQNSLRKLI